jgi:PAS domain S-box-containing protein
VAKAARSTHATPPVSRESLEETFNSIADAVIVTDRECAITKMNGVAEELTGWTLAEAWHRHVDEVLVIRTRSAIVPCPIQPVLQSGGRSDKALPDDAILMRRDGTEMPIEDSVASVRDHSGTVIGAVMVFRDATARRRTLDRFAFLADASVDLENSLDYEATLSTIARLPIPQFADACELLMAVDGAIKSIAVAHLDPRQAPQLRTIFDRCECRHLGGKHAMTTGEPLLVHDVESALDLATASDECRDAIRRVKPKSCISVPLKRGGESIGALTLLTSDPARRYDHDDLNVAVAFAKRAAVAIENARLVRDLRAARAEAESRRSEAELANRAKDEFLAVLGHELRNPLAPIVTALELMRVKHAESREQAVIERQVKHFGRLVDDLLDISRITRRKISICKEPVELASVVADGIDLASQLLEQRRSAVTVSVEPGVWVDGDAIRLAQVVSNLVNNAAKYGDEGGPIWIEGHQNGDHAVLSVRDSGAGIDEDMLRHIFDPFVQEPQALDRAHGGLGLGLAIVRGLVELHGGEVSAHSDGPGRGSEFIVRLAARAPQAAASEPHRSSTDLPLRRGRILVVDDNADVLALLVEMLQLRGYEAIPASDPMSALALARAVRPSVAILDIGLPVMDGYELARRLRALDGLAGIKLVAVSGYGLDSDRARSAAAGFDQHLVKPVSMQVMQCVLDAMTDTRVAEAGDPGAAIAAKAS